MSESIELVTMGQQPGTGKQAEEKTPAAAIPSTPSLPHKKNYVGVQICEDLMSRILIADCCETNIEKNPLRNCTLDIMFYNQADGELNLNKDDEDNRPKRQLKDLDPKHYAERLKAVMTGHRIEKAYNCVITYLSKYNETLQNGIRDAVQKLNIFVKVFCYTEAAMYHQLFYHGKDASNCDGFVPFVVFASETDSWVYGKLGPENVDVYHKSEDKDANVLLASASSLALYTLDEYSAKRWKRDTEPVEQDYYYAQFGIPIEELFGEDYNVSNVREKVKSDFTVDKIAQLFKEFLNVRPEELTNKAFDKAVNILNKDIIAAVDKRMRETNEKFRKIRVFCIGDTFDNWWERTQFKIEFDGRFIEWYHCRTRVIGGVREAAAAVAAALDGLDPLKCEKDDLSGALVAGNLLSYRVEFHKD